MSARTQRVRALTIFLKSISQPRMMFMRTPGSQNPGVCPVPTRGESLIKLAPVILVVATGIFYLNGIAFHQAYLGHFHLISSMFDDDVGSQVAFAVRGWEEMSKYVLGSAGRVFLVWVLPTLILIGLVCLGVRHVEKKRWERWRAQNPGLRVTSQLREQARRRNRSNPHPFFKAPVARRVALGGWGFFMALATIFVVVDVVSLALGVCILPFSAAGEALAIADEGKGFDDSPKVNIQTPDGLKLEFRVITCAPRFCALYRSDRIVTVPAPAVAWLSNGVPGPITVVARPNNRNIPKAQQ